MPKASAKKTAWARNASIFAGVIVALLIFGITAYVSVTKAPTTNLETKFIEFGGKTFQVAIADTPESQAKGLGDYDSLAEDEGMLFVFNTAGEYCFWMNEVEFPLDIFWINEQFEVVYSIDSLSPDTYPETFCPEQPVRYVLEIAGGQSAKLQKPLTLTL